VRSARDQNIKRKVFERNFAVWQYPHDLVELGLTSLLSKRKDLEPAKPINFINDSCPVLEVNHGEGCEKIDLKGIKP
jgi:hypothetical protein